MTGATSQLQILDGFMVNARSAGTAAQLCELAAHTAAALADAERAAIWLVNGDDPAQDHFCGTSGLGSHAPSACPPWVQQQIQHGGQASHSDLEPSALGLPTDRPFARVHAVSIAAEDIGCWVAVMHSRPVELDAQQTTLLTLLARHLCAVFEKQRIEMQRRTSELRYRTLVEQIPAVTYYRELDQVGHASFMSPQIRDILGFEPDEATSNPNFFKDNMHPDDRERVAREQQEYADSGHRSVKATYRMIHRDGQVVWMLNHAFTARSEDGTPLFVLGVIFDITETKQLEEQYRHAQKMEAVGRLAGGIAHDFNNILAVILGFGWMVAQDLTDVNHNWPHLMKMIAAGERGKHLVAQLLAFSHKDVTQPQPVNVEAVIDRMESMFRRLVRDNVDFQCHAAPELGTAWIDPSELEQIIMNLLVNATDAMPDGGLLRLQATNVKLDDSFTTTHPVSPGPYVMISVRDSGQGMNLATQQRIFEPFFTTKGPGDGTGLGLSTVHGIVQRNDGTVSVHSVVGEGTTIDVYLPHNAMSEADTHLTSRKNVRITGGTERILIVEDDEGVRSLIETILQELGYSVTVAENGEQAAHALQTSERFALVLSDVIMPGISGPALLADLRTTTPDIKTLLMSGYTDDALLQFPDGAKLSPILRKPFTVTELAIRVRQVLDSNED